MIDLGCPEPGPCLVSSIPVLEDPHPLLQKAVPWKPQESFERFWMLTLTTALFLQKSSSGSSGNWLIWSRLRSC
jgi:hypothetical protein